MNQTKQQFYARLQQVYNTHRSRGIDSRIILDKMAEEYGLTKTMLKKRLVLDAVEEEAYTNFKLNTP